MLLSLSFISLAQAGPPIYDGGISPIGPGHEPPRMPYCGHILFQGSPYADVDYIKVCGVTLNHCDSNLLSRAQRLANANPGSLVSLRSCLPH